MAEQRCSGRDRSVVELLDQRIDARLVQAQRLHFGNDVVLELLVAALLGGRERGVLELELDVLVLEAAQALVGVKPRREDCSVQLRPVIAFSAMTQA